LIGGTDRDYLDGGEGNDELHGDEDQDALLGGGGNDTLIGGAELDYLDGGDGNDVYIVGYNDAPVKGNTLEAITDSGGTDELVLEANPNELVVNLQDDGHLTLSWAGLSQGVIIAGGSAIEKFTFANGVSLSRAELLALGSNPAAVHQPCSRSGRPFPRTGATRTESPASRAWGVSWKPHPSSPQSATTGTMTTYHHPERQPAEQIRIPIIACRHVHAIFRAFTLTPHAEHDHGNKTFRRNPQDTVGAARALALQRAQRSAGSAD
jgi:hypothetical protein